MKKIIFTFLTILQFSILSSHLKAWDTTAAKFYPLNVGNVYVFHKMSLELSCYPINLIWKRKVVIDDYVLMQNGKRYYKFSGWWSVGGVAPQWEYQRMDSASMNVYAYNELNNTELLIDSLLVNSGNTFACNRFNSQTPYANCGSVSSQFVLGSQRILKSFGASYFGAITGYYSLAEGIGFLGYSSCELGSGSSYGLKGCKINGVVYGDTVLTNVHQISSEIPETFSLSQNYPNPFNPKTKLEFGISASLGESNLGFVSLKVFDIVGREVAILVNEKLNPGNYSVEFNGESLPSGVYFYKLETSNFSDTKRMIILK